MLLCIFITLYPHGHISMVNACWQLRGSGRVNVNLTKSKYYSQLEFTLFTIILTLTVFYYHLDVGVWTFHLTFIAA